jgi:hypothetical protein
VATVTAPDGTTTADEIAPTATTGGHFIGYTTPANVISGTTYTFSAYVKPNGTDSVRIRFAFAGFNNENGSHVFSTNTTTSGNCDFRIAPVANGWYRIQGTVVASSTAVGQPRIYPNQSNSWLGVPSEALYVWGAQLEVGSFPTSYIPTEGSTVTRAADVASISGSNFSGWYNQSEGTVFAEGRTINTVAHGIVSFDDGSLERWRMGGSGTGSVGLVVVDNGNISANIGPGANSWPNDVFVKGAAAIKLNDFGVTSKGLSPAVDASGTVPTVNKMLIGPTEGIANWFDGHLKRITYWPQRLPDSTLVNITT